MQKRILLSFIFLCFVCFMEHLSGNAPVAVKGLFQCNNWDFNRSGMLKLEGEWEFYWDTLLLPSSFSEPFNKPVPAYVSVPLSWTNKKNGNYPTRGYATYRLLIEIPHHPDVFALRLFDIYSASKAWFDGKIIFSAGITGTSKKTSIPGFSYNDIPVFIDESVRQHELIIQVSNYHHTRSGLIKPITLGFFSQLAHQTKSMLVINLIIIGIILVIGLTHLTTYFLRPSIKSNLYFGLLCLVMILRSVSTGDRIIIFIFPNLNWELLFKLDNFSGFGTIPLFAIFLYLLYRKEFPKIMFYLIIGLGTLIALFVLSTPQAIYGKYRMIYELYILFSGLYLTFGVLGRASLKKRKGSLLTFIGFFILYSTAINDVLISMGLISTVEVAPFGLVFYMLTQSFILTRGSTRAMSENEKLSQALKEEKQLLTNRVEERTRALQQQNIENIRQKEALEEQGWFNNSLALINNTFNQENENLEILCRKMMTEILSILDGCIGAIYLVNEKDDTITLELVASVNACREMLVNSSILPGEGLIGACYKDRQIMHISDISDSFIKVTSGLGGSLPKNILIVPLNTHDTSVGVIEIASLKTLQPNHIRLMEKASVNIASNLRLIQINKRNAQLLGSFHEKEKELRLREEELHQQLEELQTLKEEVDRYKKMDNKKS